MARRIKTLEPAFDGVRLLDRPWFPYLCTEVENWQWKATVAGHYNLWVVLSGEGYLNCDESTYRLRPGMFFVFSPGQRIFAAHYSGPRITRFAAHFRPTLSGREVASGLPFPILAREMKSMGRLQRSIEAIMRQAFSGPEQEEALSEQFYRLLLRFCDDRGEKARPALHPAIARAVRRMQRDAATVRTIDELARELGISRSHFDREFSRQVGVAPKRFLLSCRMAAARRLLESTDLRVGEVAGQLGYNDIYFFSRQFKSFFGLSPMRYRSGA